MAVVLGHGTASCDLVGMHPFFRRGELDMKLRDNVTERF
jgi:hypothetical protein